MKAYLKITLSIITIWILASFINALLLGVYLSATAHYLHELAPDVFFVFVLSMLFSIPGFFIFWIVLLVRVAAGVYERALFRSALAAGIVLASATAVVGAPLLNGILPGDKNLFILFIVISAITSIMMHFNHFKKIN